jgi:hypothetical protein
MQGVIGPSRVLPLLGPAMDHKNPAVSAGFLFMLGCFGGDQEFNNSQAAASQTLGVGGRALSLHLRHPIAWLGLIFGDQIPNLREGLQSNFAGFVDEFLAPRS